MFNKNPKCMWTYNCEKRDYDFSVDWGTVTIQRNNLHYIRITLFFWNEIDEWITKSSIFTPPNSPTSQPYTFYAYIYHSWCKASEICVQNYFGKKYKFTTFVEILYGGNGQTLVIDEYDFDSDSISRNLKFCKTDLLYKEFAPDCTGELPDC